MRIDGSVIVVTGASSGIGRATAVELAAQGARLALLARRDEALAQVAAECAAAAGTDGRTLVVPTDVSDADAVEAAARATVERFGRLDGWVSCAAVTMFGSLLDVPLADLRRVLEINLLGYVHGARAALPRFVAQDAGVLVNVSSLLGRIAQPYGSAYTMSKFAIRGLSVALREELRAVRGVSISTVLPAAVDTPIYAAAANHSGRVPQPPPPVYSAERVARVIVGQLRRPRREVVAGGVLGRAFVLQHIVAPRFAERVLALDVERSLRHDGAVPPTSGALHVPGAAPAGVDGGWGGARRERRRRTAGWVAAAAGALCVTAARRWRATDGRRARPGGRS
ncbi:SDR family NAD(P)-dependent oxidoreductase [Pseudonocardia sp. MH-G8]|uniref:SDR family NAD(P)-dependent oxidoreductase n=1 Tax=Pseudonocardia sp. MH-G8 TaxID=1854588 RepID=UPI000BA09E7C|nr:SDR family NAD(P)-dependent oxidoreductase [Pseudonocardia sp. MH-G8]OZM76166.1 short-chain dehydrogenase [Pseudonocardia sp. MH-G8]